MEKLKTVLNKKTLLKYKKQTIIIGIAILAVIFVISVSSLFKKAPVKRVEKPKITTPAPTKIINFQILSYESKSNKYLISYPGWWKMDASLEKAPADLIFDSAGNVFISIQKIEDARLSKEGGLAVVRSSIGDSLLSDTKYSIREFNNITWKGFPAYFTSGIFNDGKNSWEFQEYGIFTDKNEIYTIRTNIAKAYLDNYQGSVKRVIDSFKITGYTREEQKKKIDKALSKTLLLKEVKDFKTLVEKNGKSKFGIAVDHQELSSQVIKVFESFPDHITTFNWYKVDSNTGKIYRQDIPSGKWKEVKS